jgi:YHS domain-containing protein
MSGNHPERVLDPVCGMSVRVDAAEADGLTTAYEGKTFGFCRAACRDTFLANPALYAHKAEVAHAISIPQAAGGLPVIDEGMRRWYESCSCCLSDAFPEIKAALDAERAAKALAPAGPGICEVAEAHEAQLAEEVAAP